MDTKRIMSYIMAQTSNVLIKIIQQKDNKIIGWKGDVLEIGLPEVSIAALAIFLVQNLGMSKEKIQIVAKKDLFSVTIMAKYIEDMRILFT